MIRYFLGIFLSAAMFFSCAPPQAVLFDRAVNDAAVVSEADICKNLIAIGPDGRELVWDAGHKRILVVMWKSRDSFEKFYKNNTHTALSEDYVTWVTVASQVRRFGQGYLDRHPDADDAALELRLKQYLGLKPDWQYDVFVEMWVDPEEMFRPCVDPEISDSACNLNFSDQAPTVQGISCYPCFYKNLYYGDFRSRPGIPWTGLGYTYDWGNSVSPVGASEFILIPGAAYEIHRVIDTDVYIRQRP